MRRFSSILASFVALAALSLSAFPASAAGIKISAELGTATTAVKSDRDVLVELTLRNDGDDTVALLKWHTPFYGFDKNLFEITQNGKPVPYLGRLVHFAPPTADDYIVLAPGETKVGLVELSAVYDFTATGDYLIRYRTFFQDTFGALDRGDSHLTKRGQIDAPVFVESSALGLFIEGREAASPELAEGPTLATRYRSPSFVGCSTSRQSTLRTALGSAESYANSSLSHLNSNPSGSSRYTKWFGSYNSSRFSTVKSHFTNIRNTLRDKTVKFNCGCTQNYYAYVYPNQPYQIWVCNAFWSAPNTGTDSKAGTIVHETSHFDIVANTDDYAYGTSSAKSLAISYPSYAIFNADNHEYFAENAP